MAEWKSKWDIKQGIKQFLTDDADDFREVATRMADYIDPKIAVNDSCVLNSVVEQFRDIGGGEERA